MATDFWFKFNFKDWQNDVRPLSLTARGLLLELIIYMRQAPVVGHMPNDIRFMVRLTGALTEEINESITEFKNFGILDFVKNEDGTETLISRRIVKEFERSRINAQNGKKGGNPKLKKEFRISDSDNQNDNQIHNQIPNFIFNSNSKSNFEEKRVQGEKKQDQDVSTDERTKKIEVFHMTCKADFRLHEALLNQRPGMTETDIQNFLQHWFHYAMNNDEEYPRLTSYKKHILNSPAWQKWQSGQSIPGRVGAQIESANQAIEILNKNKNQ